MTGLQLGDDAGERLDRALSALHVDAVSRRRGVEGAPLQEVMARVGVPGVSVAAFDASGAVAARAFGIDDDRRSTPVAPRTLFQAGSISKTVTAVCALRVAAAGLLDLDAEIEESLLVPEMDPAGYSWRPAITGRLLLSHTAGLTVHGFPGYHRKAPIPDSTEILTGSGHANTSPVRPRLIPGTQFSYSGGGYVLVQRLLEDVTGAPFSRLAQEVVFDALGLEDSTFEQPLPRRLWRRAAAGHRAGPVRVAGGWHVYPEMAAAGLWTTVGDLARLLCHLSTSIAGGAASELPSGLVRQMTAAGAPNVAYGLGIYLDRPSCPNRIWHSGDTEGFVAHIEADLVAGSGVAIMTNSDLGGGVIGAIVPAVASALGWVSHPSLLRPATSAEDASIFAGRYVSADGLELEVASSGGSLWLAVPPQQPIEMRPAGSRRWALCHVDADLAFSDESPTAQTVVLSQRAPYAQEIVARRQDGTGEPTR